MRIFDGAGLSSSFTLMPSKRGFFKHSPADGLKYGFSSKRPLKIERSSGLVFGNSSVNVSVLGIFD